MPMQIRRTSTPNLAPTGLVPGQLAVEMASDPMRLWIGVPTSINAAGRRELMAGNLARAGLALINGRLAESRAANAATYRITTLSGANPSVADPVTVVFPDALIEEITAPISLTLPVGSHFNTGANFPFRLWFGIVRRAANDCQL